MRTFYRALRTFSVITLFFFCWTFLPLWQAVAWAAEQKKGQGSGGKGQGTQTQGTGARVQGHGDRFEKALEGIREHINKAEEKSSKGIEPSDEVATIKTKKAELETIDSELKTEFAATEKKLKDANLPSEILDRHRKFVKHYQDNLKELVGNLDQVKKAHTRAEVDRTVKKAKLHLEKTKPPRRHKALDPNKLPHRMVKAKEKAPRLKREDFERDFPQHKTKSKQKIAGNHFQSDLLTSRAQHKPVLLAFNDIASDVPFQLPRPIRGEGWGEGAIPAVAFADSSPFLIAQQAADLPSADDLAETPEVQFTDAIRAKAEELGNNPVKIYEYVRNNIEFAPTYGSIQGADMCLQTKQCNDMDTASLLIALLRASGIYAHYVYGTIEVPINKSMNWVGGFSDPKAALNYIASGGIPVTGMRSGGTIYAAQIEHAWVEAWIDYIPSRGAVHKQGDTWIPLDASYKQYTYKTGLDVQQITGLAPSAFVNSLISSGVTNTATGSITGINTTLIQTQLDQAKTALESHINTLQNPTVGDVIGSKDIITQQLELLPASLPYKTVLAGSKYAEMPDSLRYKVGISIYDSQSMTQSMNVTYSTAYLAGKRITIAYMPVTQADAQTLETYGYYNTKPYLVNLKPVLNIDGVAVSTGGSTGMGMAQELSVTFTVPNGSPDIITHNISAATYASIGLDLQNMPKLLLDQRNSKLKTAVSQLGQQDVNVDDIMGETLNLHNLGYLTQTETTNRMTASGKVAYSKQPAEMLTTLAPTISYLYGTPYNIGSLGTSIDVKRYPINAVSLRGNPSDEKAFMTSSGASGSAYEHTIIEELHKDAQAVSAVKLLGIANQQGIPIYTIDSSNSATILPLLQISAESMSDIQNAIAAGKRVIIPGQSIQYYDWHGEGYIITDPDTGAGAYRISGGLNGSGTAKKEDDLTKSLGYIFNVLGFAKDLSSSFIGIAKYLGKIAPSIASSMLATFGNLFAVFGAMNDAYAMYLKTHCAWNAGVAAGASLAISLVAGEFIAITLGTIVAATLLSAFMIAFAVVLFWTIIAIAINLLIQTLIGLYSFCFYFIKGGYLANLHSKYRWQLLA